MSHDRISIGVHVHPGSRHPGVGGSHNGSLIVRVAARAIDGAANDGVLLAVAHAFGLRRHEVAFARLTRSRDKVLELSGDATALTERYDELRELG
ncbi:MAG: DUF167 domain-containing protein [Actinomycetota bacterium]|nr:DUF167 domain-containing protein [Actinomycetota bacterium]